MSNIRYDDNESFGPHTTWRVAPAVIVPGSETKLKGSYGTGFKAPTLTELYVNNVLQSVVANPDLLPEISKGYDFGFEQPLFNGRFRFGATYFHNDITNLITTQFNPTTFTFIYKNIGSAEMHGVEAFAAATVSDQWKVRADCTGTSTQDKATGLGLLRRPGPQDQRVGHLDAARRVVAHRDRALCQLMGGRQSRTAFIPRMDAPAYTTVNLAADYTINKQLTVFARADNLFNRHYQNPIGFERPGLGVFGGVRLMN